MPVTLLTSGTSGQTAGGAESIMSAPAVAGGFQIHIDLNLMAAGDVIELRVYKMVKTSGTSRVMDYTMLAGAQAADAQIWKSDIYYNTLTDANAVQFGIKQLFGTTRAFPFAVVNMEDFTANQAVNVIQWNSTNVATPATAGIPDVNVKNIVNTAAAVDANNLLKVDVEDWKAGVVNALNSGKVDAVNVTRANTATAGTSTTLTLDAAASAVDSYYNGLGLIWTSGANIGVVRIITAYVGATKVATFARALPSAADATPTFIVTGITNLLPGTDGKAMVSADAQDLSSTFSVNAKNIAGQAAALDANNLLKVDTEDFKGTASVGTAGYTAPDWGHINAPTTAVDLSGTTIKNVDNTIAHVSLVDTLTTYTGNTPQTGDAFARLGAPVGVSISADIAEVEGETDSILANTDVATSTRMGTFGLPVNFSSLSIDSSGRVTLIPGQLVVKKNVALANFQFVMRDSTTNAPKTGLTVTATRNIDNVGFAGCANAVAEVANGWYVINLAASDLNGNSIGFRFTATNANDLDFTILTQP